jgi:uncharacterized protein YndB with AHSA1/START domain
MYPRSVPRLWFCRLLVDRSGGGDSVLAKIRDAGEQATRYTLPVQGSVAGTSGRSISSLDRSGSHSSVVRSPRTRALARTAKPGGRFDWNVVSDTNEREVFHFQDSYLEARSGEQLVFTWNWQSLPIEGVDGPGHTVIEVNLVAEGVNTIVTLTQSGLAKEAARTAHEKGWARCLEGMAQLLSEQELAEQTD